LRRRQGLRGKTSTTAYSTPMPDMIGPFCL
jgi:hypothetical protein